MKGRIELSHGGGGPAMRALIESVFLAKSADPETRAMDDGAAVRIGDQWLVLTTDAHVVTPPFFPGGDIGRLAVCGSVNDLAVMGACSVIALTTSLIVEEGYPIEALERIYSSIQAACAEAGTAVVAGDTKVMRKGEIDGVVLSTTGVGVTDRVIRDGGIAEGDAIIITGTIGDHGLAVLGARSELGLAGDLRSDVAPLNGLIRTALNAGGLAIHGMKDPTRGGVTSALSEMAHKANVSIVLDEPSLPMSAAARAAAELLGIDPLSVANEGKALIAVAPAAAEAVLTALRRHPLGTQASRIGYATSGAAEVHLNTGFGTRRLIERDGEPLPRIC